MNASVKAMSVGALLTLTACAHRGYNVQSIVIPAGYTFTHGQGDDSYTGRIVRSDGFHITFDAGTGAGWAAHPREKKEHNFLWWREMIIDGSPVWYGLRDDGPERGHWLMITFAKDGANFWAQIKSDSDIADTLAIAFTYKPRKIR
jgi:hypothetical protein